MLKLVLIVDDSALSRRILRNILSKDYETLEASDGSEALEILGKRGGDISAVILDIMMPVVDGYAVLKRIRSDPKLAMIPVIVASGCTNDGAEVDALALGANDFVTKPYNTAVILHRLRNTISFRETAAIANMSRRDELTGLYTRAAFIEKVSEMIHTREAGYFVMSCFDVDNFKLINDQYGSEFGDLLLKHVADSFARGFEPSGGICCRVSSDDFAVLYPRYLLDSPELDEIRARASVLEGLERAITITVGRYIVDDLSIPVSGMYDRAVLAEASVKGRYDANIAYYDESMRDDLIHLRHITNDMKPALENNQFEVFLQPQMNHSSGAVIGAEALVRWRRPDGSLVPPDNFIPIFERNGFIFDLDCYVWDRTAQLLRKWLDEGRMPLPVSVNISRYDALRAEFFDVLDGIIAKYKLPVSLLRLEITESAFSKSPDKIVSVVKRLIKRGFTVEIDDFGSGYSSLNTLKDVPAHILKLDMKFLGGKTGSPRAGNVLESIVSMARWLGMSVIAEGVENREQADFLESIGCFYVQGYLYSRPINIADYEAFCANVAKEEKMIVMENVVALDNSAFWDPGSIDTMIFNSFVGGACIFEYNNGRVELLRANRKYAHVLGGPGMTLEEAMRVSWRDHIDSQSRVSMLAAIRQAIETGDEVTSEAVFVHISESRERVCLRATIKVIARAGTHYLFYCMNEDITMQREAERSERGIAERMQAIMDNVNCGVTAIVIDYADNVRYLFANNKYYELFGYTKEDYLKEVEDPFAIIHPDDRSGVLRATKLTIRTGSAQKLEYRVICRDSSVVWTRVQLSVTRFDNVIEPVVLSIFNDITEEMEASNKLRDTGAQLKFLNDISRKLLTDDSSDDAVNGVLNDTLEYFAGNRAYVIEIDKLHDSSNNTYEVCAPGVASEKKLLQNLPNKDAHYWFDSLGKGYIAISDINMLGEDRMTEREILESQQIDSLVAVPLIRDGEFIGFIGVDDPRRNMNDIDHLKAIGDYIAVIITRRDLNARIQSDNERILALMRDTPGGFARIRLAEDGSGSVDFANEGFCELFGMSAVEIKRAFIAGEHGIIHPDDVGAIRRARIDAMLGDGKVSIDYRVRHKENNYVPLREYGRIVRNENGEAFLNAYYTELDK